jgi:hypothetical protein
MLEMKKRVEAWVERAKTVGRAAEIKAANRRLRAQMAAYRHEPAEQEAKAADPPQPISGQPEAA